MIPNLELAKFTSTYAKGTIAERFKTADNLNRKIFKNIVKLYPINRTYCNSNIIENCYKFCLPEQKNIVIYPIKNPQKGKSDGILNFITENDEFAGYQIEIPMKNNEKINIKRIPTIIHESTHILDYLLNPKYFINDSIFTKSPQYVKYFKLYENLFYCPVQENKTQDEILNNIRIKTKNALKNESNKTKILIYNYIRYSLEMERHAYLQDECCARKLKRLDKPIRKSDLRNAEEIYIFTPKIKLVEKLLSEVIKEERSKIKPLTLYERIKKFFTQLSNTNV